MHNLLTTLCIFYQDTSVTMTVATSGNLLGIQVGWISHLQQKELPLEIIVDKMHMAGHVDKWCRENCDARKLKELDNVRTLHCMGVYYYYK